ncbi:MAG: flavodoxin [Anaeroplasmataceae bacterium]|nr:flavodoxin [Anaeroplasmataceae bacterium]
MKHFKNLLLLVVTLFFAISLISCGKTEDPVESGSENNNSNGSNEKPNETNEHRILVAYFSATNTTKHIAELINEEVDGVLFEIIPAVSYTSADLNYNNSNSRTSLENKDDSIRPEIKGTVENMEQYDVVYIGYPIWFGKAPKPVYTFFEAYDFSGKTIIPFCTSGSSSIGSSATYLEKLTKSATWLNGTRFSSTANQSTVASWIEGLKY